MGILSAPHCGQRWPVGQYLSSGHFWHCALRMRNSVNRQQNGETLQGVSSQEAELVTPHSREATI
jgi:hypothetical protein